MNERRITVILEVEDDVHFCKVDFPGQVYGKEARISFFGGDGRLLRCRRATEKELVTLEEARRDPFNTPYRG